jgi:sugar phosphate isomerase/epimerase
MNGFLSRRQMLVGCGASLGTGMVAAAAAAADRPTASGSPTAGGQAAGERFRYCLNMATLRGYKLPLERQAEIAAQAGFRSIEPWLQDIEAHLQAGKSLADLKRRIDDLGLAVEDAIGFATWIVDDDAQRRKGLEQLRRDMGRVAQLGSPRIAAPPFGAHNGPAIDLRKIAERYRAVLDIGRLSGVVPQLEIWGQSKNLRTVSEAAFVAIEADHPRASILLDLFHLYKGGSGFTSFRVLDGGALGIFHMNDFPAQPPRETVTDADRVYPGDGVAPLGTVIRNLSEIGFRGPLSLELFNAKYWREQEPLVTARTGLEKLRASVEQALRVGLRS